MRTRDMTGGRVGVELDRSIFIKYDLRMHFFQFKKKLQLCSQKINVYAKKFIKSALEKIFKKPIFTAVEVESPVL